LIFVFILSTTTTNFSCTTNLEDLDEDVGGGDVETPLWHWLMLLQLLLIPWEILNLTWSWKPFKGIPELGKA
jgi:hypothetical protein